VGQAILAAAGFSAGPVKMRIRLEKAGCSQDWLPRPSKEIIAAPKQTKIQWYKHPCLCCFS